MSHAEMKRCVVIYALPERSWQWTLELPVAATVGDALNAARAASDRATSTESVPHIEWDGAEVGVFARIVPRHHTFADGDRIEIYRPLPADPRARRRERVAQSRKRSRR